MLDRFYDAIYYNEQKSDKRKSDSYPGKEVAIFAVKGFVLLGIDGGAESRTFLIFCAFEHIAAWVDDS